MPNQRSKQDADSTSKVTLEVEGRGPVPRSFQAEKARAQSRHLEQIIQLREASEDGSLGRGHTAKEWLMVAQALVDCPLPFRPTTDRQVSRRTRSRGSFITVTYTALRPEIALPTASDSRLLHWLLNKVVQGWLQTTRNGAKPSRHVEWNSAYEYLKDVGKTLCAENYKDLRSSFARISGLGITIEIEDAFGSRGRIIPFLESWDLPKSLDETTRTEHPVFKSAYGVALSEPIVAAALEHFVAIPMVVWRLLKGRPLKGALLLWAFKRAYAADSCSVVPWDRLRAQFGVTDSNPRRLKQLMKETAALLKTMWPGSRMKIVESGVQFSRYVTPFTASVRSRAKSCDPSFE